MILHFINEMIIYTDKQRKEKQKIIEVVSTDRLPDLSDMISLPYVEALLIETLRRTLVPTCAVFQDFKTVHVSKLCWFL